MRWTRLPTALALTLVAAFWTSNAPAQGFVPDLLVCEAPGCEDRCRLHTQKLFRRCVHRGGNPEACAERARAAFGDCREENCTRDLGCKRQCRAKASTFLRQCKRRPYRPGCGERAHIVFKVCVEEHCEPRPTCEERCEVHSREFLEICISSGTDPRACRERARGMFEECVEGQCELCLCPDVFAPVCGVDGNTYPNACEARCAHVEVAHEGPCRECVSNTDCEVGFICGEGRCGPCFCPQIADPVCGVDGHTYGNACEAQCAHVDIAHKGACDTVRLCRCNDDCAFGEVCRGPICGPSCAVACFVPDPVCGADGNTYVCGEPDAACHGVRVLHRGECAPVCLTDEDCPDGRCQPAGLCPDECGCASFCGPCACPEIFQPVCGVDGTTYPSPCFAGCARVDVAHPGPCDPAR